MIFKVGDRVILKRKISDFESTIIEVGFLRKDRGRYKVRKIGVYNKLETEVETWVSSDNLELDYQYYREVKLNKIL